VGNQKKKKRRNLKALVGQTITEEGIGGEVAFNLWKRTFSRGYVPIYRSSETL
jgi:hypothetical protein